MRVLDWNTLDAAERAAALRRPAQEVGEEVSRTVAEVLDEVRRGGAEAVAAFTERFDGVRRDDLLLTDAEVEDALAQVDPQVRRAIAEAAEAIRAFHAPGGPGRTWCRRARTPCAASGWCARCAAWASTCPPARRRCPPPP